MEPEELKLALADFQKTVLDRIAPLEKTVADLAEQKKSISVIETKLGRPGTFGSLSSLEPSTEVKAFNVFVKTGEFDRKAMSIGSGPDGGYAVPKEISTTIETLMLKQSVMRQICNVEHSSTSDYHKIVNRRGTAASWVGETQARTTSATSQLADISFPDGELTASPPITQRLMDDIFFDAGAWLTQELADAFVEAEGDSFINGTSINQPLGFLSLPAPVTTVDATRAFGTLQYTASGDANAFIAPTSSVSPADCLAKLVYSLKPGYRNNAVWVMAPSTLSSIAQFKDTVGRFIVNPSIVPGIQPMLFGYPIYEDEHMPAVTSNAFPIAFGNFKRGYTIVDRFDVRILRDPFTQKPYIVFYATKRVSGAPVNSEAIKVLKIAAS